MSAPWRAAFDEAWTSWRLHNFGIGAALHDPANDRIISTGRNAIAGDSTGDLPLTGNWMAHAEMNVFANMGHFTAAGMHLYTTLEPCVMCAGTSIFLNVEHVHFAVRDEYFERLDLLWAGHAYTAQRAPTAAQAFTGKLASFSRLLPLAFTFAWRPDSPMTEMATQHRPLLSTLATSGRLDELRHAGVDLADGLAALWSELPDDESPAQFD